MEPRDDMSLDLARFEDDGGPAVAEAEAAVVETGNVRLFWQFLLVLSLLWMPLTGWGHRVSDAITQVLN